MRQTLKESDNYEIDQDGNIFKKDNGKQVAVTYYVYINGKHKKSKKVIMNNLIPNPDPTRLTKMITIDGNIKNNHPSNLRWAETIYGDAIITKKIDTYLRGKIATIMRNCYGKIRAKGQSRAHKQYGGKGICVYQEWHTTLEFVKWCKSSGFIKGLWLCRYDKQEDYTPDNCYWGEPNILKLNCEMVDNIVSKEGTHKTIAEQYQITGARVQQLKGGYKLKACN